MAFSSVPKESWQLRAVRAALPGTGGASPLVLKGDLSGTLQIPLNIFIDIVVIAGTFI